MTPQQTRVLDYIKEQQTGVTNNGIATALGIPAPSVRRSTQGLETAGLVEGRYEGWGTSLSFVPTVQAAPVVDATL